MIFWITIAAIWSIAIGIFIWARCRNNTPDDIDPYNGDGF